MAVNSAGQIAGTASTVGDAEFHAVLWNIAPPTGPSESTKKLKCAKGGWQSLVDGRDRLFRNQGQCVAYSTKGK